MKQRRKAFSQKHNVNATIDRSNEDWQVSLRYPTDGCFFLHNNKVWEARLAHCNKWKTLKTITNANSIRMAITAEEGRQKMD